MLVLRCTRKLLRRLGQTPARSVPESSTRLGDWYADIIYLGRKPDSHLHEFEIAGARYGLLSPPGTHGNGVPVLRPDAERASAGAHGRACVRS